MLLMQLFSLSYLLLSSAQSLMEPIAPPLKRLSGYHQAILKFPLEYKPTLRGAKNFGGLLQSSARIPHPRCNAIDG
jgi:hypothetical protein